MRRERFTRPARSDDGVAGSRDSRTFGYNTTDGSYYASHNWSLVNNTRCHRPRLEPGSSRQSARISTPSRTRLAPPCASRPHLHRRSREPAKLLAVTPEVTTSSAPPCASCRSARPSSSSPRPTGLASGPMAARRRCPDLASIARTPSRTAPSVPRRIPGSRISTAAWTVASSGPSAASIRPPVDHGQPVAESASVATVRTQRERSPIERCPHRRRRDCARQQQRLCGHVTSSVTVGAGATAATFFVTTSVVSHRRRWTSGRATGPRLRPRA